ncbi:MAG TPA: NUDIX hydrolase [Candidatus Saccharimonadales bacterium]
MEAPAFETQYVAKVVVIDGDENVLLLRRSGDDKHRPGGSDIPGGGVEDDELHDPRLAACRELREEADIKAKPNELELLRTESKMHVNPDTRAPVLRVWYYYLLRRRKMPKVKISGEHAGSEIVPRKDAPELAADYPRVQRVFNDLNRLFDGGNDG